MSDINNSSFHIRLPLLLAIAVSAGVLIGASVAEPAGKTSSTSSNIAKFRDVVTNIDKNYVDNVDISELVDGAIVDMLSNLDPHTSYIPAEELARYSAQLKGSYDGIGIQFAIIRDTITVVKPMEGGPSQRAGLLAGDRIVKVGDELVAGTGISNKGVTDRLLGEEGSEVDVLIKRRGEEELLAFKLKRGSIPQSTVETSYMVDAKVGYIKLSRFGQFTYKEFRTAMNSLKDKGMETLILDLQSNPGGYMGAAENITDELLAGSPRHCLSEKQRR